MILEFALLYFTSAFFSGLEASFFSLDRIFIKKISDRKSKLDHYFNFAIKNSNLFIIFLLCSNLLVNIWLTIQANDFWEENFNESFLQFFNLDSHIVGSIFFVIIFTFSILIFAEFLPKKIAIVFSHFYFKVGVILLAVPFFILLPILSLMYKLIQFFLKQDDLVFSLFDKKEFIGYLRLSSKHGVLKPVQTEMLENLVNYKNTSVKSVLIPRSEMISLDISNDSKIITKARKLDCRNIVLYEKVKDNIIGVLSKKKLFYLSSKKKLNIDVIKQEISDFKIIPESKNILDALYFMNESDTEVVFVADEYGGIEGIACYEDIVKKLLADYEDLSYSNNTITQPIIKKISSDIYLIDGMVNLSEMNDYFKINLECSEAETIAGYILENIRDFPKKNFLFEDIYFRYFVKKMTNKKIIQIKAVSKK